MLTYRRIEAEYHWPEIIWTKEETLPGWFKAASRAWMRDLDEFQAFWQTCDEIYGLFDDERPAELLACVYLEFLKADELNIHISILAVVDQGELIRFFRSLKNLKAGDGFRRMVGYLVEKNTGLRITAELAGFTATGLTMQYGNYRGRTLKWIEVRG